MTKKKINQVKPTPTEEGVSGSGSSFCSVAYGRRGFLAAVLSLPFVKTFVSRERQGVEIESGKVYQTTFDDTGEIVSHYEVGTLKPGKAMTKRQQQTWDAIAERNTASLNQLVEMNRRGIRPRVCKIESIPNPFMKCM